MSGAAQKQRPPFVTAGYFIVAAFGLGTLAWIFFGPLFSNTPQVNPLNTNSSLQSDTRQAFDEQYQLGWRADGTAGNTAVEAVFYFPLLVQRLSEYAERSLIQAQTLQVLQNIKDPALVPFVVTLTSDAGIDSTLPVNEYVTLITDQLLNYPVEGWQVFSAQEGSGRELVGLLLFRRPAGAPEPQQLNVTFDGIPGNARTSTFTWEMRILELNEPRMDSLQST